MKQTNLILALIICLSAFSCKNKTDNSGAVELNEKVTVAYFHGEQRCKTCVAVGEIAEETVLTLFKDNKDVAFKEIDISKKENEAIADKYEIVGSALLIIVDGKAEDITGFAFANAIDDPAALKERIASIVNNSL